MFNLLLLGDKKESLVSLAAHLLSDYNIFLQDFTDKEDSSNQKEIPDFVLLDCTKSLPWDSVKKHLQKYFYNIPIISLEDSNNFLEVPPEIRNLLAGAADVQSLADSVKKIIDLIITKTLKFRENQKILPKELELLVGESSSIYEIKQLIHKYAKADFPVLITGESGTGKELIASLIHKLSTRERETFISRNCAAIPFTLMESELFGTEKGGYTDAVNRAGCFLLANNGSLLLDEIGEMEISSQAKLLRVIEDQEITPLGGTRPVKVNVRILSSTNKDLFKEVKNNNFRKDLYYRISILRIHIPPLRERKEDIPLLIQYFLRNQDVEISPLVMEKLIEHSWPGNVRELRGVLSRALLLADCNRITLKEVIFDS